MVRGGSRGNPSHVTANDDLNGLLGEGLRVGAGDKLIDNTNRDDAWAMISSQSIVRELNTPEQMHKSREASREVKEATQSVSVQGTGTGRERTIYDFAHDGFSGRTGNDQVYEDHPLNGVW